MTTKTMTPQELLEFMEAGLKRHQEKHDAAAKAVIEAVENLRALTRGANIHLLLGEYRISICSCDKCITAMREIANGVGDAPHGPLH